MPLNEKGLEVGEKAPTWKLKSVEGFTLHSEQFKNRPLLLFFFRGTWCPSCRKQMADVREEWERIKPLASVVGIVGQSSNEVGTFLSQHPLPYPLLPDPQREVIKSFGVYQRFSLDGMRIAFPSSLIIDGQGIVKYSFVGESQFDRPDLNQLIEQLTLLNRS